MRALLSGAAFGHATGQEPRHDSTGTTALESVPTTWEDTRDSGFFRIAAHVMDANWLEGASGLLAANDLD